MCLCIAYFENEKHKFCRKNQMVKSKAEAINYALPQKITPCPITEAVIEIRFETEQDPDIILSLFHLALKGSNVKSERLPVADIPIEFRDNDPLLKFRPHFQFHAEQFIYQVGSKVVSISTKGEYPGWKLYLDETLSFIKKVQKQKIIDKVERVGMRYISRFSGNVLPKLEFEFNQHDKVSDKNITLLNQPMIFKTLMEKDGMNIQLQLTNMVIVPEQEHYDSQIDIDISSSNAAIFLDNKKKELERMHNKEKEIFFGLLKPSFLSKLNPIY